jgi:DNA-binding response OmpR family regulator
VEVTIEHPPNPLSKGELDHSPLEGGVRGVLISISNTGSYIPEDQIDKIFDRFYQMESNNNTPGSGIGLSLAKDLVELHHGIITAYSKKGGKTTFSIFIPSEKESYHADEIIDLKENQPKREEIQTDFFITEILNVTAQSDTLGSPNVLIVEDNEEVRQYLKNNLQDKYHILEAANGKSGIQVAQKQLPALIISDVMMPEMDGFAFCDKVKSEPLTSHIPVILLTARATKEDKLHGLKTGADDYLPKPFDLEELYVRIENLIQQRKGLRERFLKEALFGIEKTATHPAEEQFIEKVVKVVNDHLDSPDYNVEQFAKDLGMSRSQLFRKIKSWTSQTPLELIRTCRLKKAASLLKTQTMNVTEASFAVGFKNTSHFIDCFKKQFGKTPKEFMY